ncbi:MAG TPA: ABC transporter substrate-binding protein [Casimicrobiaceae bacterium]|nr:ABC transporter substrate-binding protein [Casimicrobiaceae bacterium]
MHRRRSIGLLCGAALGVALPARSQAPTYHVGATPTGIPFSYLDPKTGSIQGAMVDVVRLVADQAGFAVNIEATPFASLIPALTEKRIDIIGAAMLVTAPRREVIDFSDPVFACPEGLVVNITDKTEYRSLDDLKGKIVGAQTGTVYVDFLRRAGDFAEIKLYPSLADILREVSQGRLVAGFGDAPILAYQLAQNVSLRARLVPTYESELSATISLAVRKGDAELLGRINAALAALRSDGTLDKIVVKWNLR